MSIILLTKMAPSDEQQKKVRAAAMRIVPNAGSELVSVGVEGEDDDETLILLAAYTRENGGREAGDVVGDGWRNKERCVCASRRRGRGEEDAGKGCNEVRKRRNNSVLRMARTVENHIESESDCYKKVAPKIGQAIPL